MTVLELCESCANMGNGQIKVISAYNANDRAKFNSLSELEKSNIRNFIVSTWEFIPHKKTGAIEWDFTVEITIK